MKILAGKKFVIDPGHGGEETGAIGPTGLIESHVNLKVALMLAEMLKSEGAEVIMTRTEDKHLSLQERRSLSNDTEVDLFVSIHHNANAQIDRKINRSEVYYHYGFEHGPSEDFAREIVTQLEKEFGLPGSRPYIISAYGVLRGNERNSVLGEASYISNPDAEWDLQDEKNLKREAGCYFRAISKIYQQGRLQITLLNEETTFPPMPSLQCRLESLWGPEVDPSQIEVLVDGLAIEFIYDPDTSVVCGRPANPLRGGKHLLEVRARNLLDNHAPPLKKQFTVQTKPHHIRIAFDPPEAGKYDGCPVTANVFVMDENGLPVEDSSPAQVKLRNGRFYEGNGKTGSSYSNIIFDNGRFSLAFNPIRSGRPTELAVTWGQISEHAEATLEQQNGYCIEVIDGKTKQAVKNASIVSDAMILGHTNERGLFYGQQRPEQIEIVVDGYFPQYHAPAPQKPLESVQLEPLFGGLLHGKKFIIDPEHGGVDTGVVGKNKLRSSDVNLQTARRLAAYLHFAGAVPILTRTWDNTMDDEARVRFGLQHEDAEVFLSIDHLASRPGQDDPEDLDSTWVLQKWDSEPLNSLCENVLAELTAQLGAARGEVRQTSTWQSLHAHDNYMTMQVSPLLMTAPGAADRLRNPASSDAEALGILYGMVSHYYRCGETDEIQPLNGSIRCQIFDSATETPVENALVTLDGILPMRTEGAGVVRYRFLENGRKFKVRVSAAGYETIVTELTADESGQCHKIVLSG